MPSIVAGCLRLVAFIGAAAFSLSSPAQNAFSPGGGDYLIAGALVGDQTLPHASVDTSGGWLVWQDNAIDGDGLGISAVRLNASFQRVGNAFRVNQQGAGDQERPRVALLSDGGALVVWQGGQFGFQKVFARVINANGTFGSADVLVNSYTNFHQVHPDVARLTDGNLIVVWSSFNQDGSLLGVYGQRLSPQGQKLGSEFRVNQFTGNNQRTPSVAALAGGRFVVSWVSELQRSSGSVDVYVRVFDQAGNAVGSEFAVNPSTSVICANPALAARAGGGFAVAWSQKADVFRVTTGEFQPASPTAAGWDVMARLYDAGGNAESSTVQLNTINYGDQFAPQISSFGRSLLATWVSLGHDGAREGIYGQFLNAAGALEGVEFRVNSQTASRQIHPTLATDGVNRFVVVWSTFQSGTSFDLMARAYDLIRVDVAVEGNNVRLSWNTQPGSVYQLQSSANFSTWSNLGGERTASGLNDTMTIPTGSSVANYRVIRVR